jgi:hypothetical protein
MKTISSTNECRRKHSFHSRTVTFLQLYKKWWQYHHWFFCLCEGWNGFHLISCEIQWCYQCRCHVWHTDVMNVDVWKTLMSLLQTWHLHCWHQCISHDIYFYSISVFHMTSMFMTSVFFRHLHLWHQCFRHDIYIDDISVFFMISIFMTSVFFRHLHSWHQCVRHDIYIDNIIVFHMISNENQCYKSRCHVKYTDVSNVDVMSVTLM